MAPPRIFVALAAYRDRECRHTLRDLFDCAERPDLVSAGVVWQTVPGEDDDCRPGGGPRGSVRELVVDAADARGACWAKRRALDLRDDSPLVMLIDAHMRFHPRWDVGLREMLAACPSARPALSTYPSPYEPPRRATRCQTPRLLPAAFGADGVLALRAEDARLAAPERGAFLAGGFVFSPSALWDDVPYDPNVYFVGEEVSVSARAYTHGWDVFAPPACVVHHYYGRPGGARPWDDNPRWAERNARSLARVRHLLGTEASRDPAVTRGLDGPLGLGRRRSLADFERAAGVDFRRRAVLTSAGRTGAPGAR